MSEKPILVTLSRDNADDVVEFVDSAGTKKMRAGLVRCVPYTILDKTFHDLVKYMCDPVGTDGNPSYQEKERDLALVYQSEHVENADGALKVRRGGLTLDGLILFSDPISTHFGRIVEQKTIDTAAGPMECKGIDLIFTKTYSGGSCQVSHRY